MKLRHKTSVGGVKGTAEYPSASGGVIPTPTLHFSHVPLRVVSAFIKLHHYSHSHPGGGDYAFRLDWGGQLAGACLFGWMAGNPKGMCFLNELPEPCYYRELMRLVLLDEVPRNSESQFIGWCLRWLKTNTDIAGLISFADPKHGHDGIVYRASNWIDAGFQRQDRPRLIIDGKEVHPRMCLDRYGTSSVTKLRALGLTVVEEVREPKHKYLYILQPKLGLTIRDGVVNTSTGRV